MILKVKNLEKIYRLHEGPLDRFIDLASLGLLSRHRPFQALSPLSFELKKGESLAVIGANGSGKSTLARIIAGVSPATKGSVQVEGSVAGLLGLGTGFHPDFTGAQNVQIAARLLGVPACEIRDRLKEILAFAEIGDFANQSMRTYSAGMIARLGFAVLTAVRPDLFILDEAFSAGDLYFHRKCWETLQGLKEEGTAFLIVTHNLDLVRLFCERVLWLHEGKIQCLGPTEDVCPAYEAFHRERQIESTGPNTGPGKKGKLCIRNLLFLDEKDQKADSIPMGSTLKMVIEWEAIESLPGAVFGVTLHNASGALLWGSNNHDLGPGAWPVKAGQGKTCLQLNLGALAPGRYRVTATAHASPNPPLWSQPDDFHFQRWDFHIRKNQKPQELTVGSIHLQGSWTIEEN